MKAIFAAVAAVLLVPLTFAQTPDIGDTEADEALQRELNTEFRGLDQQVQVLKKQVVDLNRELFLLEEELLFPANSQVAMFVSLDIGDLFQLDSVSLKVDKKEVANYLYTKREVAALERGGVHRIFTGNLKTGEHELVAFFTGVGPNGRDYRRGATLKFNKEIGAKYMELKIADTERKHQPEFDIQEWD